MEPRLRTAGLDPAKGYQFYQRQLRSSEQMETTSGLDAFFMQCKCTMLATELKAGYR